MHNEGMTTGGDGTGEAGKRRLLLSKEREKELSNVSTVESGNLSNCGVDSCVQ
jgi:hypothetical protein